MSNAASMATIEGAARADGNALNQYLAFILAGEEYGVDILRVQEIKGWSPVTAIPNTPAHVKGVLNLRGTIVPIIDLRLRLGLPSIAYGPTTVIVVLKTMNERDARTVGLVVDAVSDVYNVGAPQMRPPPEFGGTVTTEFIDGLVALEKKMVILLNIDRLLNTDELAIGSEALARGKAPTVESQGVD